MCKEKITNSCLKNVWWMTTVTVIWRILFNLLEEKFLHILKLARWFENTQELPGSKVKMLWGWKYFEKNNKIILLIIQIWLLVSSVAMDEEDANEIKLDKTGSFNAMQGLAPSRPGEGYCYSEIIICWAPWISQV